MMAWIVEMMNIARNMAGIVATIVVMRMAGTKVAMRITGMTVAMRIVAMRMCATFFVIAMSCVNPTLDCGSFTSTTFVDEKTF